MNYSVPHVVLLSASLALSGISSAAPDNNSDRYLGESVMLSSLVAAFGVATKDATVCNKGGYLNISVESQESQNRQSVLGFDHCNAGGVVLDGDVKTGHKVENGILTESQYSGKLSINGAEGALRSMKFSELRQNLTFTEDGQIRFASGGFSVGFNEGAPVHYKIDTPVVVNLDKSEVTGTLKLISGTEEKKVRFDGDHYTVDPDGNAEQYPLILVE